MHSKKKVIGGIVLSLLLSFRFTGCSPIRKEAREMTNDYLADTVFLQESNQALLDDNSQKSPEADSIETKADEAVEESVSENSGHTDTVAEVNLEEIGKELGESDGLEESIQTITTEEAVSNVQRQVDYIDKEGDRGSFVTDINGLYHSYSWDNLIQNDGYLFYNSPLWVSEFGIDVSEYQGDIDWELVKESGATFVFIRLGYRGYGNEGSLVLDKNYHINMKGAAETGLHIGIYFFSQAVNEEEAGEEAQFVLQNLAGYSIDYPIMFDPERIKGASARTDELSGEAFTRHAIVFCDAIREHGYETGVYTDILWQAEELDMELLKEYTIWYSDYQEVPQTPYQFTYWQYSETGRIDGIKVPVDLNLHFMMSR